MNIFRYLVIIIISNFALSCNSHKQKVNKSVDDTFYSDIGGYGLKRIPLVKPYELLKVSDDEWRLQLQKSDLLTLSIHNIKGIFVNGNFIAVYSEGGTEFLNKQYDSAWFLINADSSLEKGFERQQEFVNQYEKSTKNRNVNFNFPDSVYKFFEIKRKIIW